MLAIVTVAGSRCIAGDSFDGSGTRAMAAVESDAGDFKVPPEGKAVGKILVSVRHDIRRAGSENDYRELE
jgi:hypothetical protein